MIPKTSQQVKDEAIFNNIQETKYFDQYGLFNMIDSLAKEYGYKHDEVGELPAGFCYILYERMQYNTFIHSAYTEKKQNENK